MIDVKIDPDPTTIATDRGGCPIESPENEDETRWITLLE